MKHTRPLAKSRPMPAGQNDIFCQVAVVLTALGIPIPKELVNKCLGLR